MQSVSPVLLVSGCIFALGCLTTAQELDPPPPLPPAQPPEVSASANHWIRIRSQHFEINSSGKEGQAFAILQHFETAYAVFSTLLGRSTSEKRVRIVVFGSAEEFRPYQISAFSGGYYQQTEDDDYIVLGNRSTDLVSATHEYEHLVARHAGLNVPPWLTEGMAEVYSTLGPEADGVLIGAPPPGRLEQLQTMALIPIRLLISEDYKRFIHEGEGEADVFYAEAWALTHMLKITRKYAPGYSRFIQIVATGTASERAFRSVYGASPEDLESDLATYIRAKSLPTLLFPIRVSQVDVSQQPVFVLRPKDVKHLLSALPKSKVKPPAIEVRPVPDRPAALPGH